MTDTFKDLVEADFGSIVSAVGSKIVDKGKMAGSLFLSKLGSARAAGTLDLQLVVSDLRTTWKYYISQQKLTPSPAAVVDFLQTVFGMEMSEEDVYRVIYGSNPTAKAPTTIAPHIAVLKPKFSQLMRAQGNDEKISLIANDLVKYAERNEGDQSYIIQMLKFIGSKNPAMLKANGMKVLVPYMHGGRMSDQDVEKILVEIGKTILKRQIIIQRMADEQKGQPGAKPNSAPGDTPDDETEDSDTVDQQTGEKYKININPQSTQQNGNWGGLIVPSQRKALALEDQVFKNMRTFSSFKISSLEGLYKYAENDQFWEHFEQTVQSGDPKVVNALSAQFMQIVVRLCTENEFVTVLSEQQQKNGLVWPNRNFLAAFRFVKAGGDVNEVTAELNHFLNRPAKAAMIFITLLRLVSKVWMRENGGSAQPSPTPAPEAGE